MFTFYDAEPDLRSPHHTLIRTLLITFSLLIVPLVIIGIGLSRGDKLEHEEYVFATSSTLASPTASCLGHHRAVLSTTSRYADFVEDCGWVAGEAPDAAFYQEAVYVLYFVQDTVFQRPFAFHDYPFLIDNTEVIRVRDRDWEDADGSWYVYVIRMDRDQIDSGTVIFD